MNLRFTYFDKERMRAAVIACYKANPDATYAEAAQRVWADTGMTISPTTVGRLIRDIAGDLFGFGGFINGPASFAAAIHSPYFRVNRSFHLESAPLPNF